MAPTARHGLNWLGNREPTKSPPNARRFGFASDLKMKMRIDPLVRRSLARILSNHDGRWWDRKQPKISQMLVDEHDGWRFERMRLRAESGSQYSIVKEAPKCL